MARSDQNMEVEQVILKLLVSQLTTFDDVKCREGTAKISVTLTLSKSSFFCVKVTELACITLSPTILCFYIMITRATLNPCINY